MLELGERQPGGIYPVHRTDGELYCAGHVVKTTCRQWLAIPSHYRNLPWTQHKLLREAIKALE